MAATTTKAESQQLLTKADWPEWYSSVTRRAKRDKIWEYCNPDLPQEGSATASSSAATRADTLAATTSTTASFHRELIEPIRPTARQVNPQATLLTDLTDEELKRWTLLKDDYNERMREYNKKWKVISELDDYIESTLDRSNHTIIKDLDTPYEKLQALKQRLEPNPNQLKQAARAAYDSAQKWNSRTKLEQWVRTYRNAYQEAKLAQLALVDDFNPHYDFVKVIAQVNPACASVLQGSLVKLQQTGQDPPDFVKSCLEFFEGWQHTQPATQSGVTHTGFATFQGQQSQPTQASTQSNQSTQQNAQPGHQAAGRGRGRGRGRGGQGGQWNSTRSTCKFCTGRHQSERCYYVDPRQRTPNWQESPHYREQYNQILTSYPALRQEAEAIRSKPVPTSQYQSANQSSNQSSNAASTPVVGNDPSKQQEGTKHSAVQPPPMNALFRLSVRLPYKSTSFHTNSVCARPTQNSPFMRPPCSYCSKFRSDLR
jgi:hypothetical protein